jgi:membrane protease YdiL (CAAX protease family)
MSDGDSGASDTKPVGDVSANGRIVTAESDDGELRFRDVLNKLWAVVLALGLGWGATGLSYVAASVLIAVLMLTGIPVMDSTPWRLGVSFFTNQIAVMGGLAALYVWVTGEGIAFLNIRRPTLLEGIVAVIAPAAVFVVANIGVIGIVGSVIGVEAASHALVGLSDAAPTFYLSLIPVMILIVGPFEELLYRGIIQTRLRRSFGPTVAIGLTSVIFASIHLPAYGFGETQPLSSIALTLTALFVGSMSFGLIYEYTENLSVVALVHGFYNSLLLGLLYIATRYADEIRNLGEQATVLALR